MGPNRSVNRTVPFRSGPFVRTVGQKPSKVSMYSKFTVYIHRSLDVHSISCMHGQCSNVIVQGIFRHSSVVTPQLSVIRYLSLIRASNQHTKLTNTVRSQTMCTVQANTAWSRTPCRLHCPESDTAQDNIAPSQQIKFSQIQK